MYIHNAILSKRTQFSRLTVWHNTTKGNKSEKKKLLFRRKGDHSLPYDKSFLLDNN